MNNDLLTKAFDQAKALQKTVVDAVAKGTEHAQPLIDQALTKANDLKGTLTHGAAEATEAAQPHIEEALVHLGGFITLAKTTLAAGAAKAHEQLEPLAGHLKATIASTTAAMGKKPEDATSTTDAPP